MNGGSRGWDNPCRLTRMSGRCLITAFPSNLIYFPLSLIVPGRSLGPARVDHVTLAAALRSELEAPVRDADVRPTRSETAALALPDRPKQAASTGDSAS